MNRFLFSALFFFFIAQNMALAQEENGEIMGKVVDFETGEVVPFATISLTINGILASSQTDFDGFYSIKPIPIGKYDISFECKGYQKIIVTDFIVSPIETIIFHTKLHKGISKKAQKVVYQMPTTAEKIEAQKYLSKKNHSAAPRGREHYMPILFFQKSK